MSRKTIINKHIITKKYIKSIFNDKVMLGSYIFTENAHSLLIRNKNNVEFLGTVNLKNINTITVERNVLHISDELVKLLKEKYDICISNNLWSMYRKDIEILKYDKQVKKLYRKK